MLSNLRWLLVYGPLALLAGCAPSLHCLATPLGDEACFVKDYHIPFLEEPMRVGILRTQDGRKVVHFDTAQPETDVLERSGPAGGAMQSTATLRSALGF